MEDFLQNHGLQSLAEETSKHFEMGATAWLEEVTRFGQGLKPEDCVNSCSETEHSLSAQ